MLSWDGVSLSAKFDNIIPELLPDAKQLELPKSETNEYRKFLVEQLNSKKENPKDTIVYHSEILDPSVYMQFQKNISNFVSTFSMNTAIVALTVDVGEESPNCLFFISVTMQASFRWDEKTPSNMADQLLKSNAPALLLGYIRPYIAQITEASPINTVHIPFMNFTEQ